MHHFFANNEDALLILEPSTSLIGLVNRDCWRSRFFAVKGFILWFNCDALHMISRRHFSLFGSCCFLYLFWRRWVLCLWNGKLVHWGMSFIYLFCDWFVMYIFFWFNGLVLSNIYLCLSLDEETLSLFTFTFSHIFF